MPKKTQDKTANVEVQASPSGEIGAAPPETTPGKATSSKASERRAKPVPVAVDRRRGERKLVERRRQVDPTTCERDYTDDELEFMKAIDEYKRTFARPFPTWSEVLEVLKSLGYRKVAERSSILLNRAKPNPEVQG